MHFDIRQFWLIGSLTGAVCGLLVLSVRKIYPAHFGRVLLLLGIGNVALGINYALRLGTPWVGQFVANVVSNTLIALCLAFEYWAIGELKHQRPRRVYILGAPVAMFVISVWFTFFQRNISIENILFNVIDAFMMFTIAWSLAQPENGFRPYADKVSCVVYAFLGALTVGIILNYFYDVQFSPEYNFSAPRAIVNNISGILAEAIMFPLFLLMISDRLNRDLVVQAMRDPLTQLFNRRAFEEIAFREISGAARTGSGLTLLMIDLDQFKQVNDRYGHTAGDDVLIAVAATLRDSLRDEDFLCRWGGDEFLALLPRARQEQAQHVAERILHSFAALNFTLSGETIDIAVSIGIVTNENGAPDLASLIDLADNALYQAKKTGRRRFAFAPSATAPLTPLHSHTRA
jgi:diguanylate cyclase (GGDEF)-like protein